MKRAGEPAEVAPSYVFPASNDSSYMPGRMPHPDGGEIVNAWDGQVKNVKRKR